MVDTQSDASSLQLAASALFLASRLSVALSKWDSLGPKCLGSSITDRSAVLEILGLQRQQNASGLFKDMLARAQAQQHPSELLVQAREALHQVSASFDLDGGLPAARSLPAVAGSLQSSLPTGPQQAAALTVAAGLLSSVEAQIAEKLHKFDEEECSAHNSTLLRLAAGDKFPAFSLEGLRVSYELQDEVEGAMGPLMHRSRRQCFSSEGEWA